MSARGLGLVLAVAAAVAGCATGQPADPRVAQVRAGREALFQDNLATYRPGSPEETAAVEVLRRYKRAHDTFDVSALEALLTPSFEARFYPSQDSAEVQTRDAFLDQRRGWRARPAPARDLAIAVQGMQLSQRTGQLAIATFTTHRSRHFAPRFVEVFVLARDGAGWRLRRLLTFPARPPSPALHEARVVFTDMPGAGQPAPGAIVRDMLAEGADAVLDRHYRLGTTLRRGVRDPGSAAPYVVVFREPPPPGARIEIVEQAYGPVTERTAGTVVVGPSPSPFFYLVSRSRWWGWGYTLSVRVRLDGVPIAEETLRLE